jgi:hypothetical protein
LNDLDFRLGELGLTRGVKLEEFQKLFPVPTPNPKLPIFTEVVSLYRAGSGDNAVLAPDENWLKTIQRVSQYNYGEISVVVRTDSMTGYHGYPGIELWFYPGDEKGMQISEDTNDRLSHPPGLLVNAHDHGGAFGIRTSPTGLKKLIGALSRGLCNSELRCDE